MPMYVEIRNLIDKGASVEEIRNAAAARNIETLRDSCRKLVLAGVTTVEELLSVTYTGRLNGANAAIKGGILCLYINM